MTEPTTNPEKRTFLARTRRAVAVGGAATARGLKWLGLRAARLGTRAAVGLRKTASKLFAGVRDASAEKKDAESA